MNCRDFIYWLQGSFEIKENIKNVITNSNIGIIKGYINLAKTNRDTFFEYVCFIEGILSLWHNGYDDHVMHEHIINTKIKNYLNCILLEQAEINTLSSSISDSIKITEIFSEYQMELFDHIPKEKCEAIKPENEFYWPRETGDSISLTDETSLIF